MGCWNGTCMISNLPIIVGEKVKLVFLHTPYGNFDEKLKKPAYCYPNDIFHPGTLALDAEYDNYGGVENIEEGINLNLIENYFKTTYSKIILNDEVFVEFTIYNIIEGIKGGDLMVLYEDDNKWRRPNLNFVMIRKDVWDNIVKEYSPEFWNDDSKNNKDIYITVKEWVDKKIKKSKSFSMAGYAGGNIMFLREFYDGFISRCYDKKIDNRMTNEEIDNHINYIKNLFTEFTIIDSFISITRKGWMITSGAGSQSSEWENYKLLNKIIDNICDEKLKGY